MVIIYFVVKMLCVSVLLSWSYTESKKLSTLNTTASQEKRRESRIFEIDSEDSLWNYLSRSKTAVHTLSDSQASPGKEVLSSSKSEVKEVGDLDLISKSWTELEESVTLRFFGRSEFEGYASGAYNRELWTRGVDIKCHVERDDQVLINIPPQIHRENILNLKVLSHGFIDTVKSHNTKFVDAWMSQPNNLYSVLLVDWSPFSNSLDILPNLFDSGFVGGGDEDDKYTKAARSSIDVGNYLGRCLAQLHIQKGIKMLHMIGYSMGAHLVAKASRVSEYFSGKLADRLTGLDPAGPHFFDGNSGKALADLALNKISRTAGHLVDIIHTNGGFEAKEKRPFSPSLENPVSSVMYSLGHRDYYPAGGSIQPGCAKTNGACSHKRSLLYYLHSISSKLLFPAASCHTIQDCSQGITSEETTSFMGDLDHEVRDGLYHVKIEDKYWDFEHHADCIQATR